MIEAWYRAAGVEELVGVGGGQDRRVPTFAGPEPQRDNQAPEGAPQSSVPPRIIAAALK